MKNEKKMTEKVMVSSRIPYYVKEYANAKKLSIADLIMRGFDDFRSTDKEHALNRLEYHEKRVLHWKYIVLQDEQTCNTKVRICNTIRQDFLKAGRGHSATKRMDMSWCNAKADQLIEEGIIINGKELYEFCTQEKE